MAERQHPDICFQYGAWLRANASRSNASFDDLVGSAPCSVTGMQSTMPAQRRSLSDATARGCRGVNRLLACSAPGRAGDAPKLPVGPHAGPINPGPIAVQTCAPLDRWRERIGRVPRLCPRTAWPFAF